MRPKTSLKKLVLNKSTVIDLGNESMKAVYGGETQVADTCTPTKLRSIIVDSICKCYID